MKTFPKQPYVRITGSILYGVLLIFTILYALLFSGFTNLTADAFLAVNPLKTDVVSFLTVLSVLCVALEILHDWRRALFAALLLALRQFCPMALEIGMLLSTVLLAALSNLGEEKSNAYFWLASHVIYIILLGLLFCTGGVQNAPTINKSLWIFTSGYSYGMGHPNSLAVFFMSTWMMIWILLLPKKWWIALIFYAVGGIAVGALTLSRTVMAMMFLFPLLYILLNALSRSRHPVVLYAAAALPFVFLAVTVIMGLWNSAFKSIISDEAFWLRFEEISILQKNGLTLFGYVPIEQAFFDNVYLWLLVYCGLIPTAAVLGLYGYMQLRLARAKHIPLLAVAMLFLIYGLMENAAAYPIYFFVPMLAFAAQEQEKTSAEPRG